MFLVDDTIYYLFLVFIFLTANLFTLASCDFSPLHYREILKTSIRGRTVIWLVAKITWGVNSGSVRGPHRFISPLWETAWFWSPLLHAWALVFTSWHVILSFAQLKGFVRISAKVHTLAETHFKGSKYISISFQKEPHGDTRLSTGDTGKTKRTDLVVRALEWCGGNPDSSS